MLLPIADDNSDRKIVPLVNYFFIAINLIFFVVLQGANGNSAFTYAFSTVPAEILTGTDIVTKGFYQIHPQNGSEIWVPGLLPTPIPVYYTLLTAMFMHGSWGHLLGNLLYLWIFGDNLENKMGHFRFFLFYIICGVLAGLAHVLVAAFVSNQALVPSLGASGAISAVLGGNLVLFPHRKVTALLGWIPLRVSLWLVLGLWIVFQVINSLGVLGGEGDGIAYAAHIGGFAAGYWLVKRFVKR